MAQTISIGAQSFEFIWKNKKFQRYTSERILDGCRNRKASAISVWVQTDDQECIQVKGGVAVSIF